MSPALVTHSVMSILKCICPKECQDQARNGQLQYEFDRNHSLGHQREEATTLSWTQMDSHVVRPLLVHDVERRRFKRHDARRRKKHHPNKR